MAGKKEMEIMVSHVSLPEVKFAWIFLNSDFSTFSRCIQMLLVKCNPLQVMPDKEFIYRSSTVQRI